MFAAEYSADESKAVPVQQKHIVWAGNSMPLQQKSNSRAANAVPAQQEHNSRAAETQRLCSDYNSCAAERQCPCSKYDACAAETHRQQMQCLCDSIQVPVHNNAHQHQVITRMLAVCPMSRTSLILETT